MDGLIDAIELSRGMLLTIDLSEVQVISSAALAKLIDLKKKLNVAKGRLVFRRVTPSVMDVFRITRLDRVFDFES